MSSKVVSMTKWQQYPGVEIINCHQRVGLSTEGLVIAIQQ